jgi:hypothetical protein
MPGLHKKPGALKHHRRLPAAKARGSTRLVLRTPWPPRGFASSRQNILFSQPSNDRSAREALPSPRKLPKVNGLENHTVQPDLNRLYEKRSASETHSFCPAAHPWLAHPKNFFSCRANGLEAELSKKSEISPVGHIFTTIE